MYRRLNLHGKFYRCAYLEKWGIVFPEGKLYEDNSFNLQAMFLTDRCFFLAYEGYYQVVHEGSITSRPIEAERLPLDEWESCARKVLDAAVAGADMELFEFTELSFFTYFLFVRCRKLEYLDKATETAKVHGDNAASAGRSLSGNSYGIHMIADRLEEITRDCFPHACKNKYASLFRYGDELQPSQRLGVKAFAWLCRLGLLKVAARIAAKI